MQESVLELLLPHFELFVQAEGPPLRLDACACLQVRHKHTFRIILPLQSELRYKVNYYVVSLCAMALQMEYCRVSLCAMTVQNTLFRCQPVCNDIEMSCFMQNATFASFLANCCLSVVVLLHG